MGKKLVTEQNSGYINIDIPDHNVKSVVLIFGILRCETPEKAVEEDLIPLIWGDADVPKSLRENLSAIATDVFSKYELDK